MSRTLVAASRSVFLALFIAHLCIAPAAHAESLRYIEPQEVATTIPAPGEGEVRSAEVGRPILWTELFSVTKAIRTSTPISIKSLDAPPGVMRLLGETGAGLLFQDDTFDHTRGIGDSGGVLIPSDATQPPKVFWQTLYSGIQIAPYGPISYERLTVVRGAKGLRRELVYSGAAGGVVSLTYREYSSDLARAAFTQNLSYDLSDGDVIGFGGARLRIHSAGNVEIRYSVERPFDGSTFERPISQPW